MSTNIRRQQANALVASFAAIQLDQLQELAVNMAALSDDPASASSIILDAALAALELKMPEADFVEFCETHQF